MEGKRMYFVVAHSRGAHKSQSGKCVRGAGRVGMGGGGRLRLEAVFQTRVLELFVQVREQRRRGCFVQQQLQLRHYRVRSAGFVDALPQQRRVGKDAVGADVAAEVLAEPQKQRQVVEGQKLLGQGIEQGQRSKGGVVCARRRNHRVPKEQQIVRAQLTLEGQEQPAEGAHSVAVVAGKVLVQAWVEHRQQRRHERPSRNRVVVEVGAQAQHERREDGERRAHAARLHDAGHGCHVVHALDVPCGPSPLGHHVRLQNLPQGGEPLLLVLCARRGDLRAEHILLNRLLLRRDPRVVRIKPVLEDLK
eukprot:Rhum_TRINITY_DN16510_c0_g1::Rhum_TRINITY_DN16510_c0_g1_i1::g.163492::m.163492